MPAASQGLYVYNGPALTVAASPLLSAWLDVRGISRVMPWFVFAGGTSTHSIQGSWDGLAQDVDFAYTAPVSGTEFSILSPFIRWSTVQTVADATKSKVYLAAVVGR
jgi:hypothetical protein